MDEDLDMRYLTMSDDEISLEETAVEAMFEILRDVDSLLAYDDDGAEGPGIEKASLEDERSEVIDCSLLESDKDCLCIMDTEGVESDVDEM